MGDATCKGSYVLGTACGRCKACERDRAVLQMLGLWPPSKARRPAQLELPLGPDTQEPDDGPSETNSGA
jgi:hypothetical protein